MKKDTKDPTLETIQKCVKKTLSYKRYSAYLDWLITDSEFKNEVRLLRKKYKIPPQGWKINQSGNVENDELYIFFKDKNNSKSFRFDVDGLNRNFDLPDTWSSHISHYVLHNDINHTSNFTPTFDLIDLKYCTSGPYKDDAAKKIAQQFLSTTIKDTSQTHPIALLFTPYVSQTELVDYIKKMYKEVIEVYQEKYKRDEIQLGRIRQKSKKVSERNNFIYDNHKKMTTNELVTATNDKFKTSLDIIDANYVQKIIRSETRNRA